MQTRPNSGQIAQPLSRPIPVAVPDQWLRRPNDTPSSEAAGRVPVITDGSSGSSAAWSVATIGAAAPRAMPGDRVRRQADAAESPATGTTDATDATVSALRATYPYIKQAASAYIDDMLSVLGLAPADKRELMVVRFTKPSPQERAHIRAHGNLRIASVLDIAGLRSLDEVLTRGFGKYARADMGAARGQFAIYTRAQIAQRVPLASGDADALAAYRAQHHAEAGSAGPIVPSQIDSARLYVKLTRLTRAGQGFRQTYEKSLQQYWSKQVEPLAAQQKRIALDMLMAAYAIDALDNRDVDLAVLGFGGVASDRVKVYALDVGGHRSHNALRIEDVASGRNLLYLPGSRTPLRSFDDAPAARAWLDKKAADPAWARRFVQRHFVLSPGSGDTSVQAQLSARATAAARKEDPGEVVPMMTSTPQLGQQPFSALAHWQAQQDVINTLAVIDGGGDLAAAQKAQHTAWRVLERAQAAQQQGLGAFAANRTVAAGSEPVAAAVAQPSALAIEQKLQQIAWQQPDLRSSAAQYATDYLQQHFGVTVDAQNTYLTGFVAPAPLLGRLPPNFGGMPIADLIPLPLADATSLPWLPPARLQRRVALDELFIRNFDHADGQLRNRKGAAAFGLFTEADFSKQYMSVDTWQRIEEKSGSDGTAYGVHNPNLAASRIDAAALYRQMMRPATEGGNQFADVYRRQVAAFWRAHGAALTDLHRQAAMARLDDAMQAGRLDQRAHAFFRQGLENRPGGSLQAHPLELGNRVSTNGLRLIEPESGRTGLYLPGEAEPFRMFSNRAALEDWFDQRAKDGAWVERFTRSHFSVNDANGLDGDTGVTEFLKTDFRQGYPSHGRTPLYPKALSPTRRIEGDPFGFLSRTRQQKDLEDADWLVSSNLDYKNKEIVRELKGIPLAAGLVQAYLGRGGERRQGMAQLVDDVVTVASVVIPESLPAQVGGQAVAAADAGLAAAEGASGGAAVPGVAAELGLQRPFAGLLEPATIDYRIQPAIDDGISFMGLTPDANQVYTIGGQQYIDLDGHAARIQGLANQGRRAILVNQAQQALYGAQVWRDQGGRWQSGALKGGAPGWSGLFGSQGKRPFATPWGQLPGSAAAGIHPALVGMPSALYDVNLSTTEIQAFVRNEMTQPGNQALRKSVADKVAAAEALLLRDTNAFARQVHPGRLGFAAPPANADDASILSTIYRQASGLILGETHNEAAPVSFLLDNMTALKRNGVRTLYVELPDDLIGPDLELFNRGKPMSTNLSNYLTYGIVPRADQRYRTIDVLRAARAHGIEIRAVDTLAADQFSRTAANRLNTMNYYAYRTIQADQQANPRKWVAWVGAGHSNNTNPTGFPGLGQLLGVPSMRLQDVQTGLARTFGVDHAGTMMVNGAASVRATLANDWVLRMPRKP